MLKTTLAAATTLGALVAASPAAAQLAPSGPRVELQAGFEGDRADFDGLTYESDGAYIGFGVGYDISFGLASVGIDFEAGQSTVGDEIAYEDFDGLVTGFIENDRDLYLGGRVTVPVGPKIDLYGKAGYTNVNTIADLTIDDGVDVIREIIENDEDGLRVGAGGRYYLGAGAYVGGEYRYSRYEDSDINKHQAVATLGFAF